MKKETNCGLIGCHFVEDSDGYCRGCIDNPAVDTRVNLIDTMYDAHEAVEKAYLILINNGQHKNAAKMMHRVWSAIVHLRITHTKNNEDAVTGKPIDYDEYMYNIVRDYAIFENK